MVSYCEFCWVLLPTITQKETHFKSRGHLLIQETLLNRQHKEVNCENFCEICFKEIINSDNFKAHLSSKNHVRKLFDKNYILERNNDLELLGNKNLDIKPIQLHESKTFSGYIDVPTPTKLESSIENCKACLLIFSSKKQQEQHQNGQSHKKRVEILNTIKESTEKLKNCCEVCFLVTTTEQQLDIHIKSDKHKKRVELQALFHDNNQDDNQDENQDDKQNDNQSECLTSVLFNSSSVSSLSSTKDSEIVTISDENNEQEFDVTRDMEEIECVEYSNVCFNNKLFCKTCLLIFSSKKHQEQHQNGQNHKKRVEILNTIKKSTEKLKNCCDVCFLVTKTEQQLDIHIKSDKHKKRAELQALFHDNNQDDNQDDKQNDNQSECLTSVLFNSSSVSSLSSTKDSEIVAFSDENNEQEEDITRDIEDIECVEYSNVCFGNKLFCKTCLLIFSSKKQQEHHQNGQNHKKRDEILNTIKKSTEKLKNCCEVCFLVTATEQQLDIHIKSDRHKKRVELQALFHDNKQNDNQSECLTSVLINSSSVSSLSSTKDSEIVAFSDENNEQEVDITRDIEDIECVDYSNVCFDNKLFCNPNQELDLKWASVLKQFSFMKIQLNDIEKVE
jgi:hypothetical protein